MESLEFKTVDTHTGGEPTRIVVDGIDLPVIDSESVRATRDQFAANRDWIRELLMQEPRGHADMFGAVPVPSDDADLGVFFMDTDGYLDMCGHGLIGVVTALVERGEIPARSDLTVETPAGVVDIDVEFDGDHVHRVAFENVPSYVCARSTVDVDGAAVPVTVVYAGNYFALVEASDLGLTVDGVAVAHCVAPALAFRDAVNAAGVTDPVTGESVTVAATEVSSTTGDVDRTCVVFADGSVDRSPCGTGTCARMTRLHTDGNLAVGETFRTRGPAGATFEGVLLGTATDGATTVCHPRIAGTAYVTGEHTFYRQSRDTLESFIMG